MAKLSFNASDFDINQKIDRLYKIRKQSRELQLEILELKKTIVDNFEFINGCEYDVRIAKVKGKINYKVMAEYFLNLDNIDLEEFRCEDVLHLQIKECDSDEDFHNE